MFASGFWFEAEQLPLVAITADGIKAKDKVHCIHTRVNNDIIIVIIIIIIYLYSTNSIL